jgi:hypothetical protein
MADARLHLDLRLDVGSEPVTGEVVPRGGPATPFSGYAGLIAALTRICEPASAGGPDQSPVSGHGSRRRGTK